MNQSSTSLRSFSFLSPSPQLRSSQWLSSQSLWSQSPLSQSPSSQSPSSHTRSSQSRALHSLWARSLAPRLLAIGGALAALLMTGMVHAQVVVQEPWARATVPTQRASGVFMQLKADQDMKLVQASSAVAAHTEIHEMSHDNGVMKMREVDAIALPANQDVALAPGGLHVMLLDLKQQLKAEDTVALDLTFEDAQGKRVTQQVTVPVRPLNAGAPKSGQGDGHGHGHHDAAHTAPAAAGHGH